MSAERVTPNRTDPSSGLPARQTALADSRESLQQVAVHRIIPNPRQPRKRFDSTHIAELARSISAQGVLQPLLVRPHPSRVDHFELVAGERRLRALKLLGWTEAPVHVRQIADEHVLEAALVENLQREQLSPVEEAQAYQTLLQQYGYTQETLAQRLGRDRSTIANTIRLLGLPPSVKEDLETGRLTPGHARALLAVSDPHRQQALRRIILGRGLSVRETEALVGQEKELGHSASQGDSGRSGQASRPDGRALLHPRWRELQDRLERRYGTRIQISPSPGAGGTILIEYSDGDDFNRIYDLLTGR